MSMIYSGPPIRDIEEWADAYTFEVALDQVAHNSNPGIYDAMREADDVMMSLYEWLMYRGISGLSLRQKLEMRAQLEAEKKLAIGPDLEPEEELSIPSGHVRFYLDGEEVPE